MDTAAVESNSFQYYYSAGSASFALTLVISGGSGTGLLLPDCLGVALWGPVTCSTALPVAGYFYQFAYGTPFHISGAVSNGVSEWNVFTSWVMLRGINVYDRDAKLVQSFTDAPGPDGAFDLRHADAITAIPEPASWLLCAAGLAVVLWFPDGRRRVARRQN